MGVLSRSILPVVVCVHCALTAVVPARAWAPHERITAAAIAVLPARDLSWLGEDAVSLTEFCYLPDQVFSWRAGQSTMHHDLDVDYYVRDPATGLWAGHMVPLVQGTYHPFLAGRCKRSRRRRRRKGSDGLAVSCTTFRTLAHRLTQLGRRGSPCTVGWRAGLIRLRS